MNAEEGAPIEERFDPSAQIGRRLLRYGTLTSTNRIAAALASDPANHGVVIASDAQTAGRGQYDRSWSTPPRSAVLMSVLLFPERELRRAAILTAWAAISVCETIRVITGLSAQIKWPNDVLIRDRKVCGILCEGGARHVVVGIGLNVHQTPAEFDRLGLPAATSLAMECNVRLDVSEATEFVVRQLDTEYARLQRGKVAALESAWKEHIGLLGALVMVERMDGSVTTGHLIDMSFTEVEIAGADGSRVVLAPEAIRHLRRFDSSVG